MKFILIIAVALAFTGCSNIEKEYYDTGELMKEYQVEDGQPHGYYNEYYKNGKLKLEGEFAKGLVNGMVKEYFADGNLKKEVMFVEGTKDGEFTFYFSNGVVNEKSYYMNDEYHGKRSLYDSLGHLAWEEFYDNGKYLYSLEYDEKGALRTTFRNVEILAPDTVRYQQPYSVRVKAYGPKEEKRYVHYMVVIDPDTIYPDNTTPQDSEAYLEKELFGKDNLMEDNERVISNIPPHAKERYFLTIQVISVYPPKNDTIGKLHYKVIEVRDNRGLNN